MKYFSFLGVVASLALLVSVGVAQALPVWLPGSTVVATAGPQSGPMDVTAMMLENMTIMSGGSISETADSVTFSNGTMTVAGVWEWNWMSITLDRDPIVSFVGGFKNLGITQDFVFSTSTPIAPALPGTLYGGQSIVTFGDSNFNGLGGLSNDSSGNPIYSGTIDGTGELSMLLSVNLAPLFPGDTTQTASETQSWPGPSISGPAANSTIGIVHRFELSAGDQMTYNSVFEVVPEPGTAALLVTGLVGMALVGRRTSELARGASRERD